MKINIASKGNGRDWCHPKRLEGTGISGSHSYLFNLQVCLLKNQDESWQIIVDPCKLNQVITPTVAAVLDVVPLLEQITASST